jgi:hypothetical protein
MIRSASHIKAIDHQRPQHRNMDDYKATPLEQLKARVAKLEAQANHFGDTNKMVPPPVATDEELDDTWHKTGTAPGSIFVSRRRALYNLGVAHGQASSRGVAELWTELERERIRLAVCGVVAKADTPESAKRARDIPPDYHSASLDDVISMADALMAERAKQANSQEVAEPAPVAGGLVERISYEIRIGRTTLRCDEATAVAAILEQAEWLREQGWKEAANLLEQEAGR